MRSFLLALWMAVWAVVLAAAVEAAPVPGLLAAGAVVGAHILVGRWRRS